MVVFSITFIVTLILTVLIAYVWDKDMPLPPQQGVKALPPFPTVAPIVTAPINLVNDTVCVTLMGDSSGAYVPSALNPLRPCNNNSDCNGCVTAPVKMPLQCVDANMYKDVAEQQASLGNTSAKFCLPERRACLPPDANTLVACTHDADCAQCDDVVGDGASMQCQIVSKPKLISRKNTNGAELTMEELEGLTKEDVIAVEPGKWCLPRTGECNSTNGVLHWTTAGWKCMCRYPSVHGGDSCNIMKACNNFITTPWSRDKQQLLINEKTSTPEAWSMQSGVNPVLCHNVGAPRDNAEDWNLVCDSTNPNLVPNTVCQCDGMMLGSYMGFRSETDDPMTCTPDSCSVNAMGGRAQEPLALVDWSNDPQVPPNQCVCSGANSRIWDSDPRDPNDVEKSDPVLAQQLRTQEGYIYRGRCNDVTLPNSNITIMADPERIASDICKDPSNNAADVSSLVPGYSQNAAGDATVSVCSADPCRGIYSDINFAPPDNLTSFGHYDATLGMCTCVSPAATVTIAECNNTINPVCSTCANACVGMQSDNPDDWPCRQHPLRPCKTWDKSNPNDNFKPGCITDQNGNAQCICPDGCGNTDGRTCAKKFEVGEACFGYVGVPNICESPPSGEYAACKCHRARETQGILGVNCQNTNNFYAKCTSTTSETPVCHRGGSSFGVTCGGTSCPDEKGCDRFNV